MGNYEDYMAHVRMCWLCMSACEFNSKMFDRGKIRIQTLPSHTLDSNGYITFGLPAPIGEKKKMDIDVNYVWNNEFPNGIRKDSKEIKKRVTIVEDDPGVVKWVENVKEVFTKK